MPGLPPPPPPDSDDEPEPNEKQVALVPPPNSPKNRAGTLKKDGKVQPLPGRDFAVQPEELCTFMEKAVGNKGSVETLERDFNGIMGLAHTLRVNPALGLVRSPRRCTTAAAHRSTRSS